MSVGTCGCHVWANNALVMYLCVRKQWTKLSHTTQKRAVNVVSDSAKAQLGSPQFSEQLVTARPGGRTFMSCLFAKTRIAEFRINGSFMMLPNSSFALSILSLSKLSITKINPSVLLK